MKNLLRWLLCLLLAPVVLFVVAAVLLYVPPVQRLLVDGAAGYVRTQVGMDARVGSVRLAFPLSLSVGDVVVLDKPRPGQLRRDTIASLGTVVADVRLMPLLRGQVEIDRFDIRQASLCTADMINNVRVRARIGRLSLQSRGVDLLRDSVMLNRATLSDALIHVSLADTVPPDTTTTPTDWRVAVGRLLVQRTTVHISLPGDTLRLGATIGTGDLRGAQLDLGRGAYRMASLHLDGCAATWDDRFQPRQRTGIDPAHIAVSGLRLFADSIAYTPEGLGLHIADAALSEHSGLAVTSLATLLHMDSATLRVPYLRLATPHSRLAAEVQLPFAALNDTPPQQHAPASGFAIKARAAIGRADVEAATGPLPQALQTAWGKQPLNLAADLTGSLRRLNIRHAEVAIPTLLTAQAQGTAANITRPGSLQADLKLNARLHHGAPLMAALGTDAVRLPDNIGLNGTLRARASSYAAQLTATEGGGQAHLDATLDTRTERYTATLDTRQLPVQHFLPGMGLADLTATVRLTGRGLDLLSPHSTLEAEASVAQFTMDGRRMEGLTAHAGKDATGGHVRLNSDNALLAGTVSLDALLARSGMKATFACDLRRADLQAMRLTEKTFTTAACAHIDIAGDWRETYSIDGTINDLTLAYDGKNYRPEDFAITARTAPDTTNARVSCGDFALDFRAGGGLKYLATYLAALPEELHRQIDEKYIDQARLRQNLPRATISLHSGQENVVARLLRRQGYAYENADIELSASPEDGVTGGIALLHPAKGADMIDTVRVALFSTDTTMNYRLHLANSADNPHHAFRAELGGGVMGRGASVRAALYDAPGRMILGLGLVAGMKDGGVRLRFDKTDAIIGYKRFHINKDNYMQLAADGHIAGDLKARADDGMGFAIYADSTAEAKQDITFSLHKIDLGNILAVIPYMPDVEGTLDGDFHYVQDDDALSLSSNVQVAGMKYEQNAMGDIGSEFVYMPKDDGTHFVDATLTVDGSEVATVRGGYNPEGKGRLDGTLTLTSLPLALANGFVPDGIVALRGHAGGTLTVSGPTDAIKANGELLLDGASLVSEPYGVQMRMDDDPVEIADSRLVLENFGLYSPTGSALNVSGWLDFANLDDMRMQMRMRADNYLLINAKQTRRSEAYGKAYVNLYALAQGALSALQVKGRLDVLGSTDMVYVLTDSPLTADNRMGEMVQFVSFADTAAVEAVERPPLTGLDVDLTVNIDNNAHIKCALNPEQSNYVDLTGGGALRMRYNPTDDLRLTGRYTLQGGEMKYSLPIIPLKTFTIQNGSYVEFSGDVMNPRLNITATERVKANVGNDSGSGRTVAFDTGVVITKTVQDMGLEFTIDAPEDLALHSELQTMSVENRGKLAVTMLTTGMYMADGNTSSFSMNSALSAFLNSQINSISGSALRTLDLNFGMENGTNEAGETHTDYSFKFAKRFWNNRLRVIIGGKVSSGAEMENQNNTFFDNVTLEYRVSNKSDKHVKLFYERDTYDWLEGYVSTYGGGFVWRTKAQSLKDLLRFTKKKKAKTQQDENKSK